MVEAKRRIGLFLTIAFLLSILVAGLVYQQVSAVEAELGERVSIYVAAREIPAQVLIEATDLEPVEVPRAYLQPGMVTDPKLATGKVSLLRLKKGELLHQGALVQRVVIPPESRVLRLYRTQTLSFDDNLLAGDQVDLVVTSGRTDLPADRGSSMTSKHVAMLLSDLCVTKTHSRPHTSNDNPFSEAQFKTLKYRPEFPETFGSILDARAHCQEFFTWYNQEL